MASLTSCRCDPFLCLGSPALNLIFDDESENDWNSAKVLERLSQVTLPAGVAAADGDGLSPVGQIYWYTLRSTNPAYDVMELKCS